MHPLTPEKAQRSTTGGPVTSREAVMERRNLLVGLIVVVVGVFALSGSALAHKTSKKTGAGEEAPTCVVKSLPSFVDQAEFAYAGSVADIVEVHCQSVYAEQYVKLSANELSERCKGPLRWFGSSIEGVQYGPSVSKVQLDRKSTRLNSSHLG